MDGDIVGWDGVRQLVELYFAVSVCVAVDIWVGFDMGQAGTRDQAALPYLILWEYIAGSQLMQVSRSLPRNIWGRRGRLARKVRCGRAVQLGAERRGRRRVRH